MLRPIATERTEGMLVVLSEDPRGLAILFVLIAGGVFIGSLLSRLLTRSRA